MECKIQRGTDRRKNQEIITFPLSLEGKRQVIKSDRRKNPDRRANAFISNQILCREVPYYLAEPIFNCCSKISLKKGDVLISPGMNNKHLFLVISGCLDVHLKSSDSEKSFPIEKGECICEMSIIDGKATSAYVVASKPCKILKIDEDVFWGQIAPLPGVSRNMMSLLVERMRKQNDEAQKAFEKEIVLQHIQKELSAAKEIQTCMLPKYPMIPQHSQLEVHAFMEPAKKVGGDFYDAFPVNKNHVCIAVGDVSGKGMPAALFMVKAVTLLRTEVTKRGSLVHVLDFINETLCENNDNCMFVSLFVAIINTDTGEMSYVNAGHNPPLIGRLGTDFSMLKTPKGLAMGAMKKVNYKLGTTSLREGNVLVLYTDGITEAENMKGQLFTTQRIINLLSKMKTDKPEKIVDAIRNKVKLFEGDMPQSDDMTLLVASYRG